MTSEQYNNFFATIDEQMASFVDTWHATVAQLAQAARDEDSLFRYIHSLLQPYGFTHLQEDNERLLIYRTSAIKETKTLLLFSSCPPQPDPLSRWGAFVTRLLTFALYNKAIGNAPLNIVWLIDVEVHNENDEEPSQWLSKSRTLLQAVDSCFYDLPYTASLPTPCIGLGMKGLLRIELGIETASQDQHVFAGAILPDAAWRLIWTLNSMKDAREEIHIEGFYETVAPMEDEEIALLRTLQNGEQALKQQMNGNEFLLHLHGFQLYYTYLLLPTCTVTSLRSGSLSITSPTLPSFARATLDIHLVPTQEPGDIATKLHKHLDAQGFQDVSIKVLAARNPLHTPLRHWFAQAVCKSAYTVYDESFPVYPLLPQLHAYYPLQTLLTIPVVYAHIGSTQDSLYEHDTVTTEHEKDKQKLTLLRTVKHFILVIEEMAHVLDTTG